jgi:hypothetical protein
VIEQVFFDGVPVEPGDGAQPAGDSGPGPAVGFQVTGEELDVGAAGLEQAELMNSTDVIQTAVYELDDLLVKHGRTEELRERASEGDTTAARRLAHLLQREGSPDQAIDIIRSIADAGDKVAQEQLARLLGEHGHIDELRARADGGCEEAQSALATVLASEGRIDTSTLTGSARSTRNTAAATRRSSRCCSSLCQTPVRYDGRPA